jgi:acyl-CoA hydrolase
MGILQGGRLMHWMDMASAVCSQIHSGRISVTASIDQVYFKRPVHLGDILTIKARITRVFKTSMEIYIEVWARSVKEPAPFMTNEAYFTFVALDADAKPCTVPAIRPVSQEEKVRYREALARRLKRKTGT